MPPDQKNEKILIMESNEAFGQEISAELTKQGYRVFWIKNGPDGLKALYDILPHLLLLDIGVDGADGYEILDKKQAEPLLAKIPVFLLSTQIEPINMRRVPPGSVLEFLMTLNANPRDIVSKVDRHFGRSGSDVVAPAPESVKKKLLWVEDDKLIGTILSKKLMSSGFDLFHAKNGEEALEAIKQIVPDAVALDLVLPNMSGFDILQAIRRDPRLANVPVIILSNLSKQSDIERSKLLGAQKFLVKAAVSLDQIVQEVRSLIK